MHVRMHALHHNLHTHNLHMPHCQQGHACDMMQGLPLRPCLVKMIIHNLMWSQ